MVDWCCKKCKGKKTKLEVVEFRNKTKHLRQVCNSCGSFIRFVNQHGIDLNQYQTTKTTRQKRIESGLFVGCFICGEKSGINGFCVVHKNSSTALAMRAFCKKRNRTVWQLNSDELAQFKDANYQTKETKQAAKRVMVRQKIKRHLDAQLQSLVEDQCRNTKTNY